MNGFPTPVYNRPQRRSRRLMLKAPVAILMEGERNEIISEDTRTVTVNAHGALIALQLDVHIGQMLTLRNSRSGEEAKCRVAYIGPQQNETKVVGIDFMRPRPEFWSILFPPADWTGVC